MVVTTNHVTVNKPKVIYYVISFVIQYLLLYVSLYTKFDNLWTIQLYLHCSEQLGVLSHLFFTTLLGTDIITISIFTDKETEVYYSRPHAFNYKTNDYSIFLKLIKNKDHA